MLSTPLEVFPLVSAEKCYHTGKEGPPALPIQREPDLTPEEISMLDQFEADLERFLPEFVPSIPESDQELFFEFDAE